MTTTGYRVEKADGGATTYLRTTRRWAKVAKVGRGWHYCGGWASEVESDYWQRRDCPTKRLAMIYAQNWVEER